MRQKPVRCTLVRLRSCVSIQCCRVGLHTSKLSRMRVGYFAKSAARTAARDLVGSSELHATLDCADGDTVSSSILRGCETQAFAGAPESDTECSPSPVGLVHRRCTQCYLEQNKTPRKAMRGAGQSGSSKFVVFKRLYAASGFV